MKIFTTILLSFLTILCFGQRDFYSYLGNDRYIPLSNFDTSKGFNNSQSVIDLGFELPQIESSQLIIDQDIIHNGWNMPKRFVISPFVMFNTTTEETGGVINDKAASKIKYHKDNGEIISTTMQVDSLSFKNYPEIFFGFKVVFYRSGKFDFHYGPNNMSPEFPGYQDITFHWYIEENGAFPNFLSLAENLNNPFLLDSSNIENYSEENIKGFDQAPNKDLSFTIDPTVATSINEITFEDLFNVSSSPQLLHVESSNKSRFSVQVIGVDGKSLFESEESANHFKIDRSYFNNNIVVVRITHNKGVFVQKIKMD